MPKSSYANFSSSLFQQKPVQQQTTTRLNTNNYAFIDSTTTSEMTTQIGPITAGTSGLQGQQLTGFTQIGISNPLSQKQTTQSSFSCADFHTKHSFHSNSNSIMNLGIHFHLAGFINAETGDLLLN